MKPEELRALHELLAKERAIFAELEPSGQDPHRRWYWANQALERAFAKHGPDLLSRIEALEKALKPFAAVAGIQRPISADWPDDKPNKDFIPSAWPDWGDFRRARTTLTGERS